MYRKLGKQCVATLVAGIADKVKLPLVLSSMHYDVSEYANGTSFALGLAWLAHFLFGNFLSRDFITLEQSRSIPQREKIVKTRLFMRSGSSILQAQPSGYPRQREHDLLADQSISGRSQGRALRNLGSREG